MLHVFRVDTGTLLTVPATPTSVLGETCGSSHPLRLEGVKKQLQAAHGIAVRSQYITDHTGRVFADSAPLSYAAHGAGSVSELILCHFVYI